MLWNFKFLSIDAYCYIQLYPLFQQQWSYHYILWSYSTKHTIYCNRKYSWGTLERYSEPWSFSLRSMSSSFPPGGRRRSQSMNCSSGGLLWGSSRAMNFSRRFKAIRFRFHDLRHTFGSRLGMAGTDIKTIIEIMGHKTYVMAMRYQHHHRITR